MQNYNPKMICWMIEIYMNKVIDLLAPEDSVPQRIILNQDGSLTGVSKHASKDKDAFMRKFVGGNTKRRVKTNDKNDNSSRSHPLFCSEFEVTERKIKYPSRQL